MPFKSDVLLRRMHSLSVITRPPQVSVMYLYVWQEELVKRFVPTHGHSGLADMRCVTWEWKIWGYHI